MFENCVTDFNIRKYVFLIFEKRMSKKIVPSIFRFVTMVFKYLKDGMSKKIVSFIFRFVTLRFLNISKEYEQKHCLTSSQIPKYTF